MGDGPQTNSWDRDQNNSLKGFNKNSLKGIKQILFRWKLKKPKVFLSFGAAMSWPVALRMLEIISEAAGAQLENQNSYQTCGAGRYQKT